VPFIQPRTFLTTKEAAAHLGGRASHRSVTNLIRSGKLKGKKVANGWRILPEWLDEFMTQPDNINPDRHKGGPTHEAQPLQTLRKDPNV